MKRYNFIVHIVSNCLIIGILVGLYFCCAPKNTTQEAFAPIYQGKSDNNTVAIMLNVYGGEEYIPEIISTLKAYNATCTFFVGGSWCARNSEMLKKMSQAGEIGNHGYLHKDHKKLNYDKNIEEITLCHKQVKAITGIEMTLFAPPSGSFGELTVKACQELNYSVIMWSKDTIDWRDQDYKLIFKRATNKIANGDMILMHPTEQTRKALPLILDNYAKNNKKTVTVSEIIGKNIS